MGSYNVRLLLFVMFPLLLGLLLLPALEAMAQCGKCTRNCNRRNTTRLSSGADRFTGTAGRDCICGLGGADRIDAGAGNDCIDGGSGNDVIRGGRGDDIIFARSGDDVVRGGPGNDRLRGGSGNDILFGGQGNDNVRGNGGDDMITGGGGRDVLNGGGERTADACIDGDADTVRRDCEDSPVVPPVPPVPPPTALACPCFLDTAQTYDDGIALFLAQINDADPMIAYRIVSRADLCYDMDTNPGRTVSTSFISFLPTDLSRRPFGEVYLGFFGDPAGIRPQTGVLDCQDTVGTSGPTPIRGVDLRGETMAAIAAINRACHARLRMLAVDLGVRRCR